MWQCCPFWLEGPRCKRAPLFLHRNKARLTRFGRQKLTHISTGPRISGVRELRALAAAGIVGAPTIAAGPVRAAAIDRSGGPNGKPLKSGGFLPFRAPAKVPENTFPLAGHRGVALLNDALLWGLSGLVPGA